MTPAVPTSLGLHYSHTADAAGSCETVALLSEHSGNVVLMAIEKKIDRRTAPRELKRPRLV